MDLVSELRLHFVGRKEKLSAQLGAMGSSKAKYIPKLNEAIATIAPAQKELTEEMTSS